jgi:hypothetical protein
MRLFQNVIEKIMPNLPYTKTILIRYQELHLSLCDHNIFFNLLILDL